MKYKWKDGARIKVPAQVAGDRIDSLRDKLGRSIKAEDVLLDAENNSSPLHRAFEWSDSRAANQFRLQQARHLLNCLVTVHIRVQHPNEPEARIYTNVRTYHTITENGRRGYETTSRILSDEELREQLLDDVLEELGWFQKKYKQLKELSGIFQAIDEFRASRKKRPRGVKSAASGKRA